MRVLFCNIAWMKYYNGITDDDKPANGGSWVKENENATECLNFAPCNDGTYCGYVSTKSNRGNVNQLHIERLDLNKLIKKYTIMIKLMIRTLKKLNLGDLCG